MRKWKSLITFCLVLTLLAACTGSTAFAALFQKQTNYLEDGIGYFYGTGPNGYDLEEAKTCFFFADEEDGLTSFYLGLAETRSDETDRYEYAMKHFRDAWKQGCPLGLVALGELYEFGLGVLPGYRQAREYYQRAIDEGCAEGYYGMGNLYYRGHGVERDLDKAAEYYTKALDSEEFGYHNDALNYLAYICVEKAVQEEEPDYSKALEYLKEAVDNGYADSMYYLGQFYKFGYGVKENETKAVKYFTDAAERGSAFACNELGLAYYRGTGLKQNDEAAVEWLTRGAERGYGLSMANLGYLYQNGILVEADHDKAMEWYEAAAFTGDPNAMLELGRDLIKSGDLDDYEEALWWFFKALLYAPENEDIAQGVEAALDEMAENEELVKGGFTREYIARIAYGWNRVGEYVLIKSEIADYAFLTGEELKELARENDLTILTLDFDGNGTLSREGKELEVSWEVDSLTADGDTVEMSVDGNYLTLRNGDKTAEFKRYYAPW